MTDNPLVSILYSVVTLILFAVLYTCCSNFLIKYERYNNKDV